MSQWLEQFSLELVLTFTLTLARLGGLVLTAPFFNTLEIPPLARVWLTLTLCGLLAPTQWGKLAAQPGNVIDYLLLLGGELLLGVILGTGVMILLAGIQIAGQIAGQLSGMSLADVFNPSFDSEIPLFSHLLSLVMLAVFVLIGGHLQVVAALMHTFEALPLGQAHQPGEFGQLLVTLLSESIGLGIRAAAPVMTALILTNVLLGLVGRTLPQLNVLSLGFGINSMITLGALAIGLSTVAWLFEDRLPDTLERTVQMLETQGQEKSTAAR
jgi:flagellar biosynthetic protein FliR